MATNTAFKPITATSALPEHFVTAEVVAEHLGLSRNWIIELARAGQIPASVVPTSKEKRRKKYRFKLSEVTASLQRTK